MLTINRIHALGPLSRAHREMSDLFNAVMSTPAPTQGPAMNIWENDQAWFIEAELPGFRMEDLDVTVQGDQVSIKGRREVAVPESATYLRRERAPTCSFERAWTLPGDVASDKVEAALANGVLLVTLPKTAAAQPRKITVRQST
jgi:HSP20 family protein